MDVEDEVPPSEPDEFDDDYLDHVDRYIRQTTDDWRVVGMTFAGDEFAPRLFAGDLLIFDLGRCPWRPRGAWRVDGPPLVLADQHLIRELEYTPDGWLLTAPGHEPIPAGGEVPVLGTALSIWTPASRIAEQIKERWKDWRPGDPSPPPVA